MTGAPGADREAALAAWRGGLPAVVRGLLDEWRLAVDGDARHGEASVVVPVRRADGGPAALKVGFPAARSEHEALALQHWHGHGAVRLLRADPHRRALLLERLTGEDLRDAWDLQACEVVAGLYGRLHVPAPPQLTTVTEHVARRLAAAGAAPLPRRFLEQARSLSADLAAEPGDRLLHADLHYGTVLSDGTDWVAVAPQPLRGDPHYEPAPMLWHRFDELAGRVRDGVRDRFFALVDGAGLDEDRARAWVVVRAVALAAEAPDLATVGIAVAKAVQE